MLIVRHVPVLMHSEIYNSSNITALMFERLDNINDATCYIVFPTYRIYVNGVDIFFWCSTVRHCELSTDQWPIAGL